MTATERVQQFIGQLVVANATLQEQVEQLQQQLREAQQAGELVKQDDRLDKR